MRPPAGSAVRRLLDRACAQQREPEVRDALQQSLKLRLIADPTYQNRVSVIVRQSHPLESAARALAELSLDDEPVVAAAHPGHHVTRVYPSRDGARRSPR